MAYTNNAMKIEDDFNRVDPTSTNESVAYDLSRFDRRRIVREAVRQDDETEKKPVRRPMPRAKISYLTILFYFIVAAVAASMLISYVSLFELTVNTAARKDELEVLRNENIRLNADMEKRYNLGDIETYATDTLGMIKTDRSQVEYIELHSPDMIMMITPQENEVPSYKLSGIMGTLNAVLSNFK